MGRDDSDRGADNAQTRQAFFVRGDEIPHPPSEGMDPFELSTKSNCLLTGRPMAIRGPDEFCGEDALTGTPLWLTTTTTMSTCEIIRLETKTVVRLLHENQEFADYFLAHLLTRTARVEADLVDQLFNSSEPRS